MAYKINGTALLLNPETGAWRPRNILNLDGNGHAIYPPSREFEMKWSFMDLASYDQMINFFLAVGATGSAVVELPQFGADPYAFKAYSGCALQEPTVGPYFQGFISSVTFLITNIRT
jgi:hypothetical protein